MSTNKPATCRWLIFILALAGPVKADQVEVVTFVYEPYMLNDQRGLALDILTAAMESVGHSIKVTYYPRKRAVQNYNNGEGDLFTGVRRYFPPETIDSQEMFFYRRVLIHKHDDPVDQIDDPLEVIKGKNVAIRLGSSKFSDFEKTGAVLTQVPNSSNGLKMLERDRVDFLYALDLEALYLLRKLVPDRIDEFRFIELENSTGDVIQRVDNHGKDYIADFRRGLAKIIAQGKYLRIFETYYGAGRVPSSVLLPASRQ